MVQIGHRIKQARLRRQWSQSRLAQAARVSQPTVANWENGSHSPREAALARLSAALQVNRLWLLEGYAVNGFGNNHYHDAANGNGLGAPLQADAGYFATPILHVPVLPWPRGPDQTGALAVEPVRHLATTLRAHEPFALDCDDPAVSRAFPAVSTIIFDRQIGLLHEGGFYLFAWRGQALVRRWRSHPERFEPAGDPGRFETIFPSPRPPIMGRAVMAMRCLVESGDSAAGSHDA